MFERYTDRARRSVVLAQEHARMLRHPAIDVDHVLLGLAAEGGGVAFRALEMTGVSAEGIRDAIAKSRPPSIAGPAAGHIPFTLEAKRALEGGLRESLKLSHNFIGTEHLLLGVAADCEARPGSPCAKVLAAREITPARVREAVMALLRGYPDASGGEPAVDEDEGDPLAPVIARLDGIARDVGAIRRHLGLPG
jgi:ATP-dependent Clp protease ATP-binding subunit ClpC